MDKSIHKQIDEWVGEAPESVGDILDALATAIRETAEHTRHNWQDRATAKAWERIARAVDKAEMVYEAHKPF